MAPSLFARDIVEFDDEKLDKYLEENQRVIRIEDPDNLPQSFIQRLRDRCDPETETAASRPVDMDQVTAKLTQSLTKDGRRRLPSPGSDVFLSEEEIQERYIQREEEAYEKLVEAKGRPIYHIDQLHAVAADPEAMIHLLQPFKYWKEHNRDDGWWTAFRPQWKWWRSFRAMQMIHRESPSKLDEFNDAARKRRHMIGLTRPFTFVMDASQQDDLTTWVEYLEEVFESYQRKGGKLSRYQALRHQPMAQYLNWALDQMPLIEKEMAQKDGKNSISAAEDETPSTRAGSPTVVNGHSAAAEDTAALVTPPAAPPTPHKSARKRRRGEDEDAKSANESGGTARSKRTKVSPVSKTTAARALAPPLKTGSSMTSAAMTAKPRRRAALQSTTAATPLRRSARIAARQSQAQELGTPTAGPRPDRPRPNMPKRGSGSGPAVPSKRRTRVH
ncbi:hypothetical protein SPI_04985 [Niveomyces insectorum RCEF 264]|uniref:Uncharacterized protein n=1 Tax=Niveomyces insectorum RCEF 264 TaxID=1081102 RepID=A0A167TUJ5_9HYPO|nr:hypothetical protein SPI_04985 [Niveomyces insectorum RCEF 264]